MEIAQKACCRKERERKRDQDTKQATNDEKPKSFGKPLWSKWCVELTNIV